MERPSSRSSGKNAYTDDAAQSIVYDEGHDQQDNHGQVEEVTDEPHHAVDYAGQDGTATAEDAYTSFGQPIEDMAGYTSMGLPMATDAEDAANNVVPSDENWQQQGHEGQEQQQQQQEEEGWHDQASEAPAGEGQHEVAGPGDDAWQNTGGTEGESAAGQAPDPSWQPDGDQGNAGEAGMSQVMMYGAELGVQDSSGQDTEGTSQDDITPQAMDILAGLASLGISPELRSKVQVALSQLDRATSEALAAASQGSPSSPSGHSAGAGMQEPRGRGGAAAAGSSKHERALAALEASYQKQVAALDKKLAMSRSIMRKLYYKNVNLEKEVQVLKANAVPVSALNLTADTAALRPGTSGAAGPLGQQKPGTPQRPGTSAGAGALATAVQERDLTITQLQQALDAARRRCSLLESQMAALGRVAGGSGGPAASGARGSPKRGGPQGLGASLTAGSPQQQGIRDVLAQSAMHFTKYKQIREDYNRLLNKRAGTISSSKAASQQAKVVVEELQSRLHKEIQEREAEAALYSARLYESERQMSDWYVEKKMLEEHIAKLNDEIAQRDKLDREIEACVCSLFERLRMLEASNERLSSKLGAMGHDTSAELAELRAQNSPVAGCSMQPVSSPVRQLPLKDPGPAGGPAAKVPEGTRQPAPGSGAAQQPPVPSGAQQRLPGAGAADAGAGRPQGLRSGAGAPGPYASAGAGVPGRNRAAPGNVKPR